MAVSGHPAGERLHIVDSGPRCGPPVLLFHGLGSSAREIALPLADPLERAGLRVMAIDRPGYGDSDPSPPGRRGPAAQARRILSSLTSDGAAGAILIGHSLGAAVAVHLAHLLNGHAGGLVLVNPFCRPTRPATAPLLRLAEAPIVGPVFRRRVAPKLARPLLRSVLKASFAPDPVTEPVSRLPATPFVSENAILAMIGDLRGFNGDMDALRPSLGDSAAPA
jgi:pimeloyl-ACP methyl ester carboxylesterase